MLGILLFPFRVLIILIKWVLVGLNCLTVLSLLLSCSIIAALCSFNMWFPSVAKRYIAHKTGFELDIKKSKCSFRKGLIEFSKVSLKNPESDFTQKDCIDLNTFKVEVDWTSLFKSEFLVKKVEIDVDSLTLEKNQLNVNNIVAFKELLWPKKKENENPGKRLTASFVDTNKSIFIRSFEVALGTCKLINIVPHRRELKIDIDYRRKFDNVSSLELVFPEIMDDLREYGFSQIMGLMLGTITDFPVVKQVKNTAKKIHSQGLNMVRNFANFLTSEEGVVDDEY